MRHITVDYGEAGGEQSPLASRRHSSPTPSAAVVARHPEGINPAHLLTVQSSAGNKAMTTLFAARTPVQRSGGGGCCSSCSSGGACESGKDADTDETNPAATSAPPRTLDDSTPSA